MIPVHFFCCLARDCNYRDENCELCDKILFLKFLDVSEVFETFMYVISSHKKKRAKYQAEMLSRTVKTAIPVKRSNCK